MGELEDFGRRLAQFTDPATLSRIVNKGGMAAKKSALDAASRSLGPDRAMSNLRRGRAKLNVGYDELGGTKIAINLRGPWKLAEGGRRKSGKINPKRRSGNRAVKTPMGPRARSSYGPSRGLGTTTAAVRDAEREAPKAAFRQVQDELRRLVR